MTNLEKLVSGEPATYNGYEITKVIEHNRGVVINMDGAIVSIFCLNGSGILMHIWITENLIDNCIDRGVIELGSQKTAFKRLMEGEKATWDGKEIFSVADYSNHVSSKVCIQNKRWGTWDIIHIEMQKRN